MKLNSIKAECDADLLRRRGWDTHQTWFRHIWRSNCFQSQWRARPFAASDGWCQLPNHRRRSTRNSISKRATRFWQTRDDTHAKQSRTRQESLFFSSKTIYCAKALISFDRGAGVLCMLRAIPCQTCTIFHCVRPWIRKEQRIKDEEENNWEIPNRRRWKNRPHSLNTFYMIIFIDGARRERDREHHERTTLNAKSKFIILAQHDKACVPVDGRLKILNTKNVPNFSTIRLQHGCVGSQSPADGIPTFAPNDSPHLSFA